jgi:hypothetical protein
MKSRIRYFGSEALITLFIALLVWTASAPAEAKDKAIPSPRDILIRASDGIGSRRCGALSVNLRSSSSMNLRIMAISTFRSTITMTTDTGIVLMECRKTTKTCYATWRRRDMKRGQNEITTAAIGSNNCSMSISSYVDVP